jgi:hypothetical protein
VANHVHCLFPATALRAGSRRHLDVHIEARRRCACVHSPDCRLTPSELCLYPNHTPSPLASRSLGSSREASVARVRSFERKVRPQLRDSPVSPLPTRTSFFEKTPSLTSVKVLLEGSGVR